MLDQLKSYLKGKVAVVGIGNTLRSDDAAGSSLATRLQGRVPFEVIDAGAVPENYLGKIVKLKPDTIVLIDVADFGGKAGEIKILPAKQVKSPNLFFTHNASISMSINYLQNSLRVDIIILIIQPKNIDFGDKLSKEVTLALKKIESFFIREREDARS